MSVITANYPTIARAYSMRVCLRLPMLMCVCCVHVKTHPPPLLLSRSPSPAHPCFFLSVDCKINPLSLSLSLSLSLLLIVNILPSSFSCSSHSPPPSPSCLLTWTSTMRVTARPKSFHSCTVSSAVIFNASASCFKCIAPSPFFLPPPPHRAPWTTKVQCLL